MTHDVETLSGEDMSEELRKGTTYEFTKFEGMPTGYFPFDCPYGIYVEKLSNGFLRFIWDNKDLLVNGGSFIESRPAPTPEVKEWEKEFDKIKKEYIPQVKEYGKPGTNTLQWEKGFEAALDICKSFIRSLLANKPETGLERLDEEKLKYIIQDAEINWENHLYKKEVAQALKDKLFYAPLLRRREEVAKAIYSHFGVPAGKGIVWPENCPPALMEILANIEHERWSSWMWYQFSKGRFAEKNTGEWIMPAKSVAHWQELMKTPYSELSEELKESDRREVRKTLVAIDEFERLNPHLKRSE